MLRDGKNSQGKLESPPVKLDFRDPRINVVQTTPPVKLEKGQFENSYLSARFESSGTLLKAVKGELLGHYDDNDNFKKGDKSKIYDKRPVEPYHCESDCYKPHKSEKDLHFVQQYPERDLPNQDPKTQYYPPTIWVDHPASTDLSTKITAFIGDKPYSIDTQNLDKAFDKLNIHPEDLFIGKSGRDSLDSQPVQESKIDPYQGHARKSQSELKSYSAENIVEECRKSRSCHNLPNRSEQWKYDFVDKRCNVPDGDKSIRSPVCHRTDESTDYGSLSKSSSDGAPTSNRKRIPAGQRKRRNPLSFPHHLSVDDNRSPQVCSLQLLAYLFS